jgi:hypothetical protein
VGLSSPTSWELNFSVGRKIGQITQGIKCDDAGKYDLIDEANAPDDYEGRRTRTGSGSPTPARALTWRGPNSRSAKRGAISLERTMSYKAIYAYPWDIVEAGRDAAIERFAELGLDTVTVAGAYHAGKFLRPHGTRGKVYFPEDGTVYFRPRSERYSQIRPLPNQLLSQGDPLRELCAQSRLSVNVWLVLLHNSQLCARHPEATVANAFGDRYVYSLCPAAPHVRDYAIALAADVASAYPVRGLSLETPGYLPYAHGYHHEFALNRPNAWLDNQLGLCFCDHCLDGARHAGVDAECLRRRVASDVQSYLASDVEFPSDMAEAFWLADTRSDGELKAYLDWRCEVVTSLVREIRAAAPEDVEIAVIPSVARPSAGAWYEGSDLAALARAAGILEACLYEPGSARVKADLFDLRRRLRGKARLRGILRPAYPDFNSRDDFVEAMRALGRDGVEEIGFYNWGHLRDSNLEWIPDGLAALAAPA